MAYFRYSEESSPWLCQLVAGGELKVEAEVHKCSQRR